MIEIKENNFFIPQKLAIGFQNRSNTYTGKLGYVTYYDNKGVMRKDKSWNGWRDDSIDPLYIDNVPTEGFVLNRSVGGGRGWDARDTWTRIWDPRGFEFEISIENLLWILEWCACSPGKGLEQKFVYSWRGTDLILMPVNSDDYKASMEVSNKMFSKTSFKEKDLVPGTLYKVKGKYDNEVIFIGKVLTTTHFGKFTKSQLLFLSADTEETQYEWRSLPNRHRPYSYEDRPKYAKREVIQYKSAGSVIAELTPNYISQEEIDTYIERFNASPFSAYFWNNLENVVDKFVTRHPMIAETVDLDDVVTHKFYGSYTDKTYKSRFEQEVQCTNFELNFIKQNPIANSDYEIKQLVHDNMYHLRSVISEDGKSVKLYNKLYTLVKSDKLWDVGRYEENRLYHFANIDLNTGIVEKVTDVGVCSIGSNWSGKSQWIKYTNCEDEEEIKRAQETAFEPVLGDGRDLLYYVTKNGYVSDALQSLLTHDNLTFLETENTKKFIEWILSSQGQEIVEKAGYIPLK